MYLRHRQTFFNFEHLSICFPLRCQKNVDNALNDQKFLLKEGNKGNNINEVVNCEWRAWERFRSNGSSGSKITTMSTCDSGKDVSISIHYLVIGTILSVCTFVEQCFVFIVFYKNKHLRKVNNYYMLSLTCADLLISILSMPLWTTFTTLGYWPLSRFTWDFGTG